MPFFSFSIIFPRFMGQYIIFLWPNHIPLCGYATFVYQFISCFHLVVVMNNVLQALASKCLCRHVSISHRYAQRSGSVGSYDHPRLNFLRNGQKAISMVVAQFYFPTSSVEGFWWLYMLPNTCCYLSFWLWPSQWVCNGISPWFSFAFSLIWLIMLNIFTCVLFLTYILL